MNNSSFNLTTEPWIQVIDNKNQEQTVSLIDLFKNAQNYRQLAGDMRSQDLAILRFLEAILTTVYSRFNSEDEPYDWLKLNQENYQVENINQDDFDQDDLLDTWKELYDKGHFTEIVIKYLEVYRDKFDLFGKTPFYQVTKTEYDSLVDNTKKIATGNGIVAIKQINRTISESNNSIAVFSPRSSQNKNKLDLAQLVRWIINYQNYTGTTDKTKIVTDKKYSALAGWLYGLNPVYVSGENLFLILMHNLVLFNDEDDEYSVQKPVWEFESHEYIKRRLTAVLPDNIAELYTVWSRVLHIEWKENNSPIIFSACLPKIDNKNSFKIEPMTTWNEDRDHNWIPDVRSIKTLNKAMWRNFGEYININKQGDHQPGIVSWINRLKNKQLIPSNMLINLINTGLIKDTRKGKASSQLPFDEFYDNMRIKADVLFDDNGKKYWAKRIEEIVEWTQKIGKNFQGFAKNIADLKSENEDSKNNTKKKSSNQDKINNKIADRITAKFYENLNYPFLNWLRNLSAEDDRDEKKLEWEKITISLVRKSAKELLENVSASEILGRVIDGKKQNIFTLYNAFNSNIAKHMDS